MCNSGQRDYPRIRDFLIFGIASAAHFGYIKFMVLDLTSLDEDTRRRLYAKLAMEFSAPDSSKIDADLFGLLVDIDPRFTRTPISRFIERFGARNYQDRVTQFNAIIRRAVPASMRKNARDEIKRVMLRTLIDYLDHRGIMVSLTSVFNNFDYVEVAVDRSFPGYIKAKLLHKILPIAA